MEISEFDDSKAAQARPRLRIAQARDDAAIAQLLDSAFGGSAESELVMRLRDAGDLAMMLVAETDADADMATVSPKQEAGTMPLIGVIGFSNLPIEGDRTSKGWALAPLAVCASARERGVGSALVRAGLLQARKAGVEIVCVLGQPKFYQRLGFSRDQVAEISSPWSSKAFLGFKMSDAGGAVSGRAVYADAFDPLSGRDPTWNVAI